MTLSGAAKRPQFPRRAVVTAGMPYGNKGLHFGHIGGVFVPADYFARFLRDRLGQKNVIFVSGTDCYGSPIMEGYRKLVEEGYEGTIEDYVTTNHVAQREALAAYDISLDRYAASGLGAAKEIHAALTAAVLERLHQKGHLKKLETLQFFDIEANQFLNGRQVIGKCPVRGCAGEKAYADECDMGHQFSPEDLIDPKSQLSGTTPELRPVANWYFDLPAFEEELKALTREWDIDPQVRSIVVKTVRESLVPPQIYIQTKFRDAFKAVAPDLPPFKLHEPEGNAQSFSVEFGCWEARDAARSILEAAKINFRASKCLLPFRITGNISWGVPAPVMDGTEGLTVWCWPESLWAPISFSQTVLTEAAAGRATDDDVLVKRPDGKAPTYSSDDWHAWWCADDASVFQFIGQDNIYFYCVAQPAIWAALEWNLFQDTPVANHHILFMNKKASSSGAIKPPMAKELLDNYTAEQLRCHWLSLGLDSKAVSFNPKAFDTSESKRDKKTGQVTLVKDDPRVADPALKESVFLTNIFNRLARSCFYGAQRHLDGHLPQVAADADLLELATQATLDFERAMYQVDLHGALAVAEEFGRAANKRWDSESKAAGQDEAAYEHALANAFAALRTLTLLMHPAVPRGCEEICAHLNVAPELFFSWEHAMSGLGELVALMGGDPATHTLVELPPRTDFFKKHESQYK